MCSHLGTLKTATKHQKEREIKHKAKRGRQKNTEYRLWYTCFHRFLLLFFFSPIKKSVTSKCTRSGSLSCPHILTADQINPPGCLLLVIPSLSICNSLLLRSFATPRLINLQQFSKKSNCLSFSREAALNGSSPSMCLGNSGSIEKVNLPVFHQ